MKIFTYLCPNPKCGLRTPALESDAFNGRCPRCLEIMQIVDEREPAIAPPNSPVHGTELVVLVDNVRSAFNVGAILRTSECFGVKRLILCGITPGTDNTAVLKASVGAEAWLSIENQPNLLNVCKQLELEGFTIWALELGKTAQPVNTLIQRPAKLALVIGNERCGVDQQVLNKCAKIVYIPMLGNKNSLNVEVSFGVALGFITLLPAEN